MRYTIIFSIFLLLLFAGCKKTEFSSTPSLKFESVNTTQLRTQELLIFKLSFTDGDGDLTDSIFVQEVVPNCPNSNISGLFPLPVFPTSKDLKGDLNVTFGYNVSGYTSVSTQCPPENDTARFRFALKDKAQHVSDTVSSPVIIIYN